MIKVKNIGLRKIIAWSGEILPGHEISMPKEEFDYLETMLKGELKIVEVIVVAPIVVAPIITAPIPRKKKRGV